MSAATATSARTTSAVTAPDGWEEAVEFMASMFPAEARPVVSRQEEPVVLPAKEADGSRFYKTHQTVLKVASGSPTAS
jgi:hypothetical protein